MLHYNMQKDDWDTTQLLEVRWSLFPSLAAIVTSFWCKCTHADVHTYLHTSTQTCILTTCIHTHIQTHMCTYTHIDSCVYIHGQMRTYTRTDTLLSTLQMTA